MCPSDENKTNELSANVSDESTQFVPAPEDESTKPGWSRRTFLKAAALGAAASVLINRNSADGLRFGAASALADTLSNINCTANDVRIIGPGIIVNEPCNCSGTFTARVRFRINNNTGTDRYCVTVHFCPGTNGFDPGDVVIGTIPPGDDFYEVDIPNYPCGSGLVCFGSAGSGEDGGFAKGETCPTGQCCTVISWNVRPNEGCPQDHSRIIKSKCRAQQVCIQGRGATLACIANCEPDCGGTATLRLCGSGGVAPYSFSLSDGTNTYQPNRVNGACAEFDVTVTETTTFTGTVTDSSSPRCAQQSNPVTLNAEPVDAPTLEVTGPDCAGSVTISVTNCDSSLTYTFKEGSTTLPSTGCSMTRTFAPGSHTVTVTASNAAGTCTAEASTTFSVNQLVAAVLSAPAAGCDGVVTMTVTASGGTGSYDFVASAGTLSGSGNTRTVTLQPQLNGICRTVTVTVTDTAGCSATSNAQSFSQCVSTSTSCPHPNT